MNRQTDRQTDIKENIIDMAGLLMQVIMMNRMIVLHLNTVCITTPFKHIFSPALGSHVQYFQILTTITGATAGQLTYLYCFIFILHGDSTERSMSFQCIVPDRTQVPFVSYSCHRSRIGSREKYCFALLFLKF